MKRILLSFFVLISGFTSAQVYFRAGGGYAIPIATHTVGVVRTLRSESNGNDSTFSNKSKIISTSYGSGTNFNVGGGFMFSKYFGIDVNISYLMGRSHEIFGYHIKYYTDGELLSMEEFTITAKSRAIFVTPSFIITKGGANTPYGRFGIVMGSPSINNEASSYDGTNTRLQKFEYKGGISIGFQGAVGINWTLGANLKLYTEVNFVSMTYYPKKFTVTESTYNGVSDLDQYTVHMKEGEFVRELDLTTIQLQDPAKPAQLLGRATPFSSLSLQVGVVYSIGRKSTLKPE